MKSTKYYVWRILATVEGETEPRLLIPNSDPDEHEYPMDMQFDTVELAYQGLVDYGVEDQAVEEEWVLCTEELTPINKIDPTLVPEL